MSLGTLEQIDALVNAAGDKRSTDAKEYLMKQFIGLFAIFVKICYEVAVTYQERNA